MGGRRMSDPMSDPKMEQVLVVEDESRLRELFAQFLREKGYRVSEARDGQEAIALTAKQPFDLIMMDIKMPRMDGLSALQQIRSSLPASKIILTTGYSVTPDLDRVLDEDEAIACLRKPFTFEDLMDAIRRLGEQGTRT
jgi:CheY-like chemotaxis protein